MFVLKTMFILQEHDKFYINSSILSSLDILYIFLFDMPNILSFETPVARGYDNESIVTS